MSELALSEREIPVTEKAELFIWNRSRFIVVNRDNQVIIIG